MDADRLPETKFDFLSKSNISFFLSPSIKPNTPRFRFESSSWSNAAFADILRSISWIPGDIELDLAGVRLGRDYPPPIVQHDEARKNTLIRYAMVKKETA